MVVASAESEEKRETMSEIETGVVDSRTSDDPQNLRESRCRSPEQPDNG